MNNKYNNVLKLKPERIITGVLSAYMKLVLLYLFSFLGPAVNSPGQTRQAVLETGLKSIPVLCYHQVRDWKATDSKDNRTYILPPEAFSSQVKMLHDSGYNAILPGQLMDYLDGKGQLPTHPVLLTFDDGTASQYQNALPQLDKAGYKAVFFIMTVVLNKPNYLSKAQIADLDKRGHIIGCHTWDHKQVTRYKDNDWITELLKPKEELEKITGKPVTCFAYPNGAWNEASVDMLMKYGFTLAFQLWGKLDAEHPLFTIKRVLVSGYWHNSDLMKAIHNAERK